VLGSIKLVWWIESLNRWRNQKKLTRWCLHGWIAVKILCKVFKLVSSYGLYT